MAMKERYTALIKEIQHHLFNELLPFWIQNGVDKEYGGFLTYFDANGQDFPSKYVSLISEDLDEILKFVKNNVIDLRDD